VAIREDGKWVAWQEPSQVQVIDPDKSEHVVATMDVRTGSFSGGWSGADRSLSRDGRWLALRTGETIGIYDLASEQFAANQPASSGATQATSKVQSAEEKKPAVWQPAVAGGRWLQRLLMPQAGQRQIVAPLAHEAHRVIAIEQNTHLDSIVISSTGRWLLTGDNNRWRLWDLQDKQSPATAIDIGADLIHASFSPGDRWLVSYKQVIAQVNAVSRLEITLWDLAATPLRKSSKVHELTGSYSIGQNVLAFSGNNKWLASNTGGVRIWPIADDGTLGDPETLATQQYGGEQAIALSADGRLLAAAENQAVRLWDRSVTNPTLRVRELHGHEQSVVRVAFSPDGAWLVSTSQDGDVRLWDLRDEQLQDAMIALKGDYERQNYLDIQSLQFSADGRWLAAGTHSGVYFWRLDPTSLLDEARRLAGRDLNPDELARYRLNTPERQRDRLLRQAELVTARLEKNPQDIAFLQRRTDLYAFAGEFNAAIDDLRLISRLQPDDHWPVYCLLTLLAQTNQADEYRRVAEAMATRFHDPLPANYEILERVAKASLFWADSGADWKKIAPLADRALEKSVATKHWVVSWAQIAKAMAEYRLGNYEQALEWADKGLGPPDAPPVYTIAVPGNFVKAVAHAQLGQLEEAQAALAKAKKVQADVPTPLQEWTGWNDWYMCAIMLREADALLLEKSPTATALAPKTE
jgi:tetratricopeptide (TPR) repeat protein